MRNPLVFAAAALLAACAEPPTGTPADLPDPSFNNAGGWTTLVTGGGKWAHVTVNVPYTSWISMNVRQNAAGQVSGMYEYGENSSSGLRFRFHGEPDCLAVNTAGTIAVMAGPITLSQGEDAPLVGSRMGFAVYDGGPGTDQSFVILLTGGPFANITCPAALGIAPFLHKSEINKGNFTIQKR